MNATHTDFRNFSDVLLERSRTRPDRLAFSFLDKAGDVSEQCTYRELHRLAQAIAADLVERCAPSERVLLLLPSGLDFIGTLFACWYAGVTPVPVLPPEGGGAKRALPRLGAIGDDAGCHTIIATEQLERRLHDLDPEWARQSHWLLIDHRRHDVNGDVERAPADGEHIALLQYTSGSTGTPRGVEITHANLLSNSATIQRVFRHDERSQGVIWLPPQHDMGLVGGILQPIFAGFPTALMSPMSFLQRPVRWLEAISRFRATTSGAPDFAYRMCVDRVSEEQKQDIELDSWSVAFSGADTVRASTLRAFAGAFTRCGFRPRAFHPCYGLAEATLMVTGAGAVDDGGPRVLRASRHSIAGGAFEPADHDAPDALELTSCGAPCPDHSVVIRDPVTKRRALDGAVGEVLCAGPGVAAGYWKNERETAQAFGIGVAGDERGYLRTGDLGFLHHGELFVTGRSKDLIIVAGKNHFPGDIETSVELALRAQDYAVGAVCAFEDDDGDDPCLTVCVEIRGVRKLSGSRLGAVSALCLASLSDAHHLRLGRALIVRPGAIPRTTSGKIQRRAALHDLRRHAIEPIHDVRFAADLPTPDLPGGAGEPPGCRDDVVSWLKACAASRHGVPVSAIDTSAAFTDYGLGSLDAVALVADLSAWVGCTVSATALWDYPNIEALADHVCAQTGIATPTTALCVVAAAEHDPRPPSEVDVAIVGISCRSAGAGTTSELWELLQGQRQPIGFAPSGRPGAEALDRCGLQAGYLEGVERFDAAFFNVSPDEARTMDPQQRLLLEGVWHALESAGIVPDTLEGSRTGVFVGISNADYARSLSAVKEPFVGTGNALSLAANRVSYAFDLNGPSLAIDTACSSSLVALHLACQSIRSGESDIAIVAGVNLILTPELTELFQSAGMLSATSRCHTFGQAADGYVRGEGCGVVVLKRVEQAVANGDRLFALVRGTAVNQDGRTNGITAPNGRAQTRCIEAALRQAGAAGADVDFVETHGTATPLGDPIEVQALTSALSRESGRHCHLGALKANIGHLESAAGILGLIKVALVLHHGVVPPQPAFSEVNERVGLLPWLRVCTAEQRPAAAPRLAGVSAFGFGGTNAHAIVACVPEPSGAAGTTDGHASTTPLALYLGGRSERALRALAERYRAFIDAGGRAAARAVSNVSLLRRARLPCRVFVIGRSTDELLAALSAVAGGQTHPQVVSAARPADFIWCCGELDETVTLVRRWEGVLPGLKDAFEKAVAQCPPSCDHQAVHTLAAHHALLTSFGRLGVVPARLSGAGLGEVAAAVYACELDPSGAADLLAYVGGHHHVTPGPFHVKAHRHFSGSDGLRADRICATRLRRRVSSTRTTVTGGSTDDRLCWQTSAASDPDGDNHPLTEPCAHTATLRCLARAELGGAPVDWRHFLQMHDASAHAMPRQDVPGYPFDPTPYWQGADSDDSRTVDVATMEWQPRVLDPRSVGGTGEWLVVGENDAMRAAVCRLMDESGIRSIGVDASAATTSLSGIERCAGVLVIVPALTARTLAAQLMSLVTLGQAVNAVEPAVPGGVRVVTRGGCARGEAPESSQGAVGGIVRTLANEHPELGAQVIDIPATPEREDLRALVRELGLSPDESVVLGGARAQVARLMPCVSRTVANTPAAATFGSGTIVISGGLGGLGLALARRFAELGTARLVLLGRDAHRRSEEIRTLRSSGTRVDTRSVDVRDRRAVAAVFDELERDGEHVSGIVHAAGIVDDGLLSEQSLARLEAVISTKVDGANNLADAGCSGTLGFFCCISSLSGVMGSPGQGAYAAANTYLDGFASELRHRGVAASTFALGPIEGGGMANERAAAAHHLGLDSLPVAAAADAVIEHLHEPLPWYAFTRLRPDAATSSLVPEPVRRLTGTWLGNEMSSDESALLMRLRRQRAHRHTVLRDWIAEQVASALRRDVADIATNVGLLDMGLDSLMILQLRALIQRALSIKLAPAVLFEHPTIDALTHYVIDRLFEHAQPATSTAPRALAREPLEVETTGFGAFLAELEAMDESEAQRLAGVER